MADSKCGVFPLVSAVTNLATKWLQETGGFRQRAKSSECAFMGVAEAFINTLRRDYIASADLASAQAVLAQIPEWFADYNAAAPHSALGFRSPLQYRSERSQFDLAESVS